MNKDAAAKAMEEFLLYKDEVGKTITAEGLITKVFSRYLYFAGYQCINCAHHTPEEPDERSAYCKKFDRLCADDCTPCHMFKEV